MYNTIILGPSKVGKTALVASLKHASDIATVKENKLAIRTIPKNQSTRDIFVKAMTVVQEGDMPFPGTSLDIQYDFIIELKTEPTGLWENIETIWGGNECSGRFMFMDAPGGAVFNDDIKRNSQNNPTFKNMVQQMLDAQGIILCVDMTLALENNAAEKKRIQDYYLKSLRFFLSSGFQVTIPFQRVCFLLTKSDLYLERAGLSDKESTLLHDSLRPMKIVREIVGLESLKTLSVFSEPDSQICFSTTSVFGFINGTINSHFKSTVLPEGEQYNPHYKSPKIIIRPEEWQPYNIAESFAFMLSGEKHHPAQDIMTFEELRQHI
ncbi:MAG: hypothetical protein CMK59_13360 [Proteobacteria bacterium]|nr:hypothetical protein [Pseudomonadota bacterium]